MTNPVICMLDFHDTMLLVRLTDLTMNGEETWPPGYGCFTVGADINNYEDVKACMRSGRGSTQKLHHRDGVSEITITGIHRSSSFWLCNFSVVRTNVSENTVIWDASSNSKLNFTGIWEMTGEDVDDLAVQAVSLIEKYKYFSPTASSPSPSQSGGSYADDVAAVIALTKPAAVFCDSDLSADRLLIFLCGEAVMRGFTLETAPNFTTAHTKHRSVVLGQKHTVQQVVEIMERAVRAGFVDDLWRLGELLGYPERPLTRFRDFGFNNTIGHHAV